MKVTKCDRCGVEFTETITPFKYTVFRKNRTADRLDLCKTCEQALETFIECKTTDKKQSTTNGININSVESLRSGACFHGEVWLTCPYCGEAMEMMGSSPLCTIDGYRVYECSSCHRYVKDK